MTVARQRPSTANGIVFMLLEDEHGQVNLIVPRAVYEQHPRHRPRRAARPRARPLRAGQENRNVLVSRLESLSRSRAASPRTTPSGSRSHGRTPSATVDSSDPRLVEGIRTTPGISRVFSTRRNLRVEALRCEPDGSRGLEVHAPAREHIGEGDHVLDAGAGGLSPRSTCAARRRWSPGTSRRTSSSSTLKTASVEEAIESRQLFDIVDLGRFDDASFDAVVCYGGPELRARRGGPRALRAAAGDEAGGRCS